MANELQVSAKQYLVLACVGLLTVWSGCNEPTQRGPVKDVAMLDDPMEVSTVADASRDSEVLLVEEMATARNHYKQQLQRLVGFYDQQGNQLKAHWATEELEHLEHGPQRVYLVPGEVAGPDLRAGGTVDNADQLYREGIELYKQGQGMVGTLFAKEKLLYQAIDKFDTLINTYPNSDKIDDAAFQIAEIYNHYLKDYTTALLYYKRVWTWDPQTTLPVRFAVARIYDEHLRDLDKALDYYQQAMEKESAYVTNTIYARNRIKRILGQE